LPHILNMFDAKVIDYVESRFRELHGKSHTNLSYNTLHYSVISVCNTSYNIVLVFFYLLDEVLMFFCFRNESFVEQCSERSWTQ
jgi:hypothetical protein